MKGRLKNMKEIIFPLILIILDVLSAIPYAVSGDYKKSIYWIAAAILNICVTF